MKKAITVLMVLMLVLVGCGGSKSSTLITSTDALAKIDNKDSFIFYVGSKDCSACQQFAPTFEEVAQDYPDLLFSVELTKEAKTEDFEKLQELIGTVTATPTIFVIKDGVVVDKKVSILKYSDLQSFLERFEIEK